MNEKKCLHLKGLYKEYILSKKQFLELCETKPLDTETIEEFKKSRERLQRVVEQCREIVTYQIDFRKAFMQKYQQELNLEYVGMFTDAKVARASRVTDGVTEAFMITDGGEIVNDAMEWYDEEYKFGYITPYVNGYAIGHSAKIGKNVFIDETGKTLPIGVFDEAGSFFEGVAWVHTMEVNEPDVYLFVDESGDEVFEEDFEAIGSFLDGVAPVKYEGKWYFLNKPGDRSLIDIDAEEVNALWYGRSLVKLSNGRYTYIKKDGIALSDKSFFLAYPFQEGFALVREQGDGVYTFIDVDGNVQFNKDFSNARSFSCGRALVHDGEEEYYINLQGKKVFAIEKPHSLAQSFEEGVTKYVRDGKWHFKDRDGNDVWSDSR